MVYTRGLHDARQMVQIPRVDKAYPTSEFWLLLPQTNQAVSETWRTNTLRMAGGPSRWLCALVCMPGHLGMLTILERGGIDLAGGGPRPRAVERLHHDPILCKLLQVVQGVDLTVPRGLHLHNAVLPIAAGAVFPVANLVATDHPILEFLLWGLQKRGYKWNRVTGWAASTPISSARQHSPSTVGDNTQQNGRS